MANAWFEADKFREQALEVHRLRKLREERLGADVARQIAKCPYIEACEAGRGWFSTWVSVKESNDEKIKFTVLPNRFGGCVSREYHRFPVSAGVRGMVWCTKGISVTGHVSRVLHRFPDLASKFIFPRVMALGNLKRDFLPEVTADSAMIEARFITAGNNMKLAICEKLVHTNLANESEREYEIEGMYSHTFCVLKSRLRNGNSLSFSAGVIANRRQNFPVVRSMFKTNRTFGHATKVNISAGTTISTEALPRAERFFVGGPLLRCVGYRRFGSSYRDVTLGSDHYVMASLTQTVLRKGDLSVSGFAEGGLAVLTMARGWAMPLPDVATILGTGFGVTWHVNEYVIDNSLGFTPKRGEWPQLRWQVGISQSS